MQASPFHFLVCHRAVDGISAPIVFGTLEIYFVDCSFNSVISEGSSCPSSSFCCHSPSSQLCFRAVNRPEIYFVNYIPCFHQVYKEIPSMAISIEVIFREFLLCRNLEIYQIHICISSKNRHTEDRKRKQYYGEDSSEFPHNRPFPNPESDVREIE